MISVVSTYVNDEELQSKIAEAVQGLGEFFQSIGSDDNTENDEDAFSGFEHINSKEAQEAMNDLFTKMEQTMNEATNEATNNETQNEQTQEESNTKDSTTGASSLRRTRAASRTAGFLLRQGVCQPAHRSTASQVLGSVRAANSPSSDARRGRRPWRPAPIGNCV